ncbi:MAG: hypothetical protein IIU73_02360, partial [Selenomonadales bacterium]|nr:hypothetical protein [Selenomonadales bacterium]
MDKIWTKDFILVSTANFIATFVYYTFQFVYLLSGDVYSAMLPLRSQIQTHIAGGVLTKKQEGAIMV